MAVSKLSELGVGQRGVVERIDAPAAVMSLVQMGCCAGATVEVCHATPGQGPMAICTCGRTLAVRKAAAECVWVRT